VKFIYCINKNVADDLEKVGLKKLGYALVNGDNVAVFANNKNTYLNIYQKGEIFLSNKLFFEPIEE